MKRHYTKKEERIYLAIMLITVSMAIWPLFLL